MNRCLKKILLLVSVCFTFGIVSHVDAATLRANPSTGVYTVGKPFTVTVALNTDGKPVNAADGQISFNPKELQVTGVSRSSSIFNLWTEEPKYSNTSGSISFGGGSPSGYIGSNGNIITITFKALGAGTPKLTFKSGSILAADGQGTNILTSMNGGTYTIASATETPAPEYIAPANTPKAPVVTSVSHPDEKAWYNIKNAKLSWKIPDDVIAVRTLLDKESATVPTIVYDSLIKEKTIENLDEGVSYFHIQFKNKEGWGRITHYRLNVDSQEPSPFTVSVEDDQSTKSKVLVFNITDTSPISEYQIQIDTTEAITYRDEKDTKRYVLPVLTPGRHSIIVEAKDAAGNIATASYSLEVVAFEKPIFTEYPDRVNTDVIPAIKGKTRPNAKVSVEVRRAGDTSVTTIVSGDADPFSVSADQDGEFTYVPDSAFEPGVYVITALSKDESGMMSERSDEIRIIVEKPGYVQIGSMVINALSVIIPLASLVLVLIFGLWYLWHRLSTWRRKIRKETHDLENSLALEFGQIIRGVDSSIQELREARKDKFTKQEVELLEKIEKELKIARSKISKEIKDVEDVIN